VQEYENVMFIYVEFDFMNATVYTAYSLQNYLLFIDNSRHIWKWYWALPRRIGAEFPGDRWRHLFYESKRMQLLLNV